MPKVAFSNAVVSLKMLFIPAPVETVLAFLVTVNLPTNPPLWVLVSLC